MKPRSVEKASRGTIVIIDGFLPEKKYLEFGELLLLETSGGAW
jgi:hypothetical protein